MNISLAKIGLEHIKSFSGQIELDLAPMTLFVGPNNSGKSTVIHALNILKESYSRDARSHIDIQEFLKTIITTGGMRERYGKMSEFVKEGENEVSKISYSIKIPGMQGDVKVTAHIEKKNETEFCISKYVFSEPYENKYLFSFQLENKWDSYKTEYYFRCNFSNIINHIKGSENLSSLWWKNEIERKNDLKIKYALKINELYHKITKCLLSIYSKDELIEFGKIYAQIMLEHGLADLKSIEHGNIYLVNYLSSNLFINESILDPKNLHSIDLEVINNGVELYEIFRIIYTNTLHSRLNSYMQILSVKRRFLEITKIDMYRHSEIEEIRKFEEEDFKGNILDEFSDDLYDFLKSNPTFKNVNEVFDKDEIRYGLEDLSDMNNFFSTSHVFENVSLKDNYLNAIDGFKLADICLNIKNIEIFDSKSIFDSNNKLFRNIFEIFAQDIIINYKKKARSKRSKTELINSFFIETLNKLRYKLSEKTFLPKSNNYFIEFVIDKKNPIDTIRNIHLNILYLLGSSLYYKLEEYSPNPIEDRLFDNILGKEMGNFKRQNEDFLTNDYPVLSIIKLKLFYFLKQSDLTELITLDCFNELNKYHILEWEKYIFDDRLISVYESILNKVDLDTIELCIANLKKANEEIIFEKYISYLESFIIPSFGHIRKLFTQKINWLPANKTKFKRHIPLDSDSSEPIVKAILLQNDEYEKSRIIRTNRYLKALSIDGHLEAEKNLELDIATLRFIQGDKISNIMDEGHGFSQLAIMCHYFDLSSRIDALNNQVLFIEEPEVSLHPSLQSKLADVFKIASKEDGIQLVIETHSEYLIRKLQYLTAKGELNKGDVAIYYFSDPKTCKDPKERVFRIDIEEDGSLSRPFGSGFYDETNNIIMDMMMLNFPDNKN